jgi:pimeloyl-ACP methyl ester carboxylesterase
VALHAALMHPDQVHSLTLLEPCSSGNLKLVHDKEVLDRAERFFTAYADRVVGGETTAVGEMFNYWFGPGAFTRPPAAVHTFLMSAAAKNGADVRAAFADQLTVQQLAGSTKPVLVAYGTASPPVAPAIARAVVGLIARARRHAIHGAGHGMLDSHSAEIADLMHFT